MFDIYSICVDACDWMWDKSKISVHSLCCWFCHNLSLFLWLIEYLTKNPGNFNLIFSFPTRRLSFLLSFGVEMVKYPIYFCNDSFVFLSLRRISDEKRKESFVKFVNVVESFLLFIYSKYVFDLVSLLKQNKFYNIGLLWKNPWRNVR